MNSGFPGLSGRFAGGAFDARRLRLTPGRGIVVDRLGKDSRYTEYTKCDKVSKQ